MKTALLALAVLLILFFAAHSCWTAQLSCGGVK